MLERSAALFALKQRLPALRAGCGSAQPTPGMETSPADCASDPSTCHSSVICPCPAMPWTHLCPLLLSLSWSAFSTDLVRMHVHFGAMALRYMKTL
eukprot:1161814-Pelagomonas_calceolata.AAC.1